MRKAMTLRRGLIALLAIAAPALVLAHDLWIEPTHFLPQLGQAVGVHLKVGVDLVGEPVPRIPSLVKQFTVSHAAQRSTLPGRAGADPAGQWRVAAPGLHVIGYHSHPSRVELPPARFNAYLEEEGLDAIRALRATMPASDKPVRELFSRHAYRTNSLEKSRLFPDISITRESPPVLDTM